VFDDEALRTFLDPSDGVVSVDELARASAGAPVELSARIRAVIPVRRREHFDALQRRHTAAPLVARARSGIMRKLFWPLVYWNRPDDYEELAAGEHIHPEVVARLELDGTTVCDIGAGAGRFTLLAARSARHVIALDAVPALLQRLEQRAQDAGLHNIVVMRAGFCTLPLPDNSVHVAVACSVFTHEESAGTERALREAERIVEPGGQVAVIWPHRPEWFAARGYDYCSFEGNTVMHFRDLSTAQRLCERYYSPEAARWVNENGSADVPFSVLGTKPPNDVCIKRVG